MARGTGGAMVTRAARKSALFSDTRPKLSLLATIFFRTSQTIEMPLAYSKIPINTTFLITKFIPQPRFNAMPSMLFFSVPR